MKICGTCKLELPFEMFQKQSRSKDGLRYCCKKCKRIEDVKYREKYKENIKNKKQVYYKNNSDYIKEKTVKFQKSNPDKVKIYSKQSRLNLKLEIFNHYCNNDICCKHCGLKTVELLTVDHIHGGGNKHKKEVRSLYSWIKRNNYPDGFQILCWSCQLRKKTEEIKPKNPTEVQLRQSAYVKNIKHLVLEQYGSVCPCGETDEIVLTLDHVNDDGAEHRRTLNARGFNFYMWLKKNNYPKDVPLQTICANCQYRKIYSLDV